MKNIIYVVAGGWDYEGSNLDTVSLFTLREAAEEYGRWLVEHEGYDFFTMVERTVETTR